MNITFPPYPHFDQLYSRPHLCLLSLHAVERYGFRYVLLLFLRLHSEYNFVHEGSQKGASDGPEPVDPVVGPVVVPQSWPQRPGWVHAAASIGPKCQGQGGHRQPESDRHRVRVPRVPAVPDSGRDKHQYPSGYSLEQQALDSRQISVQVGHAERASFRWALAGQATSWRHHLKRARGFLLGNVSQSAA